MICQTQPRTPVLKSRSTLQDFVLLSVISVLCALILVCFAKASPGKQTSASWRWQNIYDELKLCVTTRPAYFQADSL